VAQALLPAVPGIPFRGSRAGFTPTAHSGDGSFDPGFLILVWPVCAINDQDLRSMFCSLEPQAELFPECGENGWLYSLGLTRIKRVEFQNEGVKEPENPVRLSTGRPTKAFEVAAIKRDLSGQHWFWGAPRGGRAWREGPTCAHNGENKKGNASNRSKRYSTDNTAPI
jgi:hypothetical protein